MDSQVEKVYVALGNDLQDGFKTLDWTLKKWKQIPISIVILHVTCNISSDFVYTPFGKMPASSVSDEKLEVLRTYEQEKLDKLLAKYIAFCGKIKAEIQKVEKSDEPIQKVIVDLISTRRITKLVMGTTFLKSQSWKSKSAIGGSFYVHKHKPEFCEFFIICGGKLVSLKGKNEDVVMEDDQGAMAPKRANFTKWIGKMFPENSTFTGRHSNRSSASSKSLESSNAQKHWEDCVQEIENYFECLLSLNLDEENDEEKNDDLQTSPMETSIQQQSDSTMNAAEKMEYMRRRIDEAEKIIQLKKEESKANAERSAKAEWAISLCNTRVEELESKIKEEVADRLDLKKSLDAEKEQLQEIISDVQESKNRLSSLLELQSELSNKLHMSSLTRSNAESQLAKAIVARAELVREIEELRRQRDVLHRRIEFCKEKDAIGKVSKMNELTCGYREYTAEDIRLATDNFSESLRLKSWGDWTNVYRGRIDQATVAIKMLISDSPLSEEVFLAKVKLLNNIRHPHLVATMGFCTELKCIIYEYMSNGSLRDTLFSYPRSHRKRNRVVRWHDRIRIAHEVCSSLAFLHSAKPMPIVHGLLTTSNILLDRNLVAKVGGVDLTQDRDCDLWTDVRAFGVLLAQILTGRNWAGLIEDDAAMDSPALARVLDEKAGKWPLDLAQELAGIARKCLSSTELSLSKIMEELETVRKMADDLVAKGGLEAVDSEFFDKEDSTEVPGIFLCPIFQDVMKNPHVAADGFSYELGAIEEWLNMGRETSPMTNLRLKHKHLTPNLTLRALIQDWHSKKSTVNT